MKYKLQRKSMTRRDLNYPVFLECSSLCRDAFWQNIFEELAYNKPPYGTYISKGYLCCSYKGKEFSYKIEPKEASTVKDEVYDLLFRKVGILSSIEKLKNRQEFTDIENDLQQTRSSWTSIKKKTTRDLLVELYVTEKKLKHSLSDVQARYLYGIVINALTFKALNSSDIVYKNGAIVDIHGVDFVEEQVVLRKNFLRLETSFASIILENQKTMSENWLKFIESLRKFTLKKNKKEVLYV